MPLILLEELEQWPENILRLNRAPTRVYTGEIYGEWYSQLATLEETQQTMAQRLRVIMAKYDLARISMSLWAQDDPEEGIDWDVEAASKEGEAFCPGRTPGLGAMEKPRDLTQKRPSPTSKRNPVDILATETPLATTAHTTQALDAELPCNGNYVFFGHWATPEGVIEYHGGMPHSSSIYWGNLIPTEIQQIFNVAAARRRGLRRR